MYKGIKIIKYLLLMTNNIPWVEKYRPTEFDNIILKRHGINVGPIEDTMLLSYTLDAGINRHNLDTLSEIHLNHKAISYKDLVGSGFDTSN